MVRWRLCLALALLLLLPLVIGGKNNDDDDDEDSENKEDLTQSKIPIQKLHSRRSEDSEEEEDDDDDDDDEGGEEKGGGDNDRMERPAPISGRRSPILVTPQSSGAGMIDRERERIPMKRRPLECYVCAYKSETPLRACLDPTKFRVHTITCHSVDDKCFTSVISKGEAYEAVVRGCRSGCVGSAETTCCEVNRCNNQAFAMPLIQPRAAAPPKVTLTQSQPLPKATATSKTNRLLPPTVMFFTMILLILQTVGKVACV